MNESQLYFELIAIVDKLRQAKYVDQRGLPFQLTDSLVPSQLKEGYLRVSGNMLQALVFSRILDLQNLGYSPNVVQLVSKLLADSYAEVVQARAESLYRAVPVGSLTMPASATKLAAVVPPHLYQDSGNAEKLEKFGLELGVALKVLEDQLCFRVILRDPSWIAQENIEAFSRLIPVWQILQSSELDFQHLNDLQNTGQVVTYLRDILSQDRPRLRGHELHDSFV